MAEERDDQTPEVEPAEAGTEPAAIPVYGAGAGGPHARQVRQVWDLKGFSRAVENGEPPGPSSSVATLDDPERGRVTQIGIPIRFSATPGAIKGPAPRPGSGR